MFSMSYKRYQAYFFMAVLSASILLTLIVFWPYLTLLAFGGVVAVVSRPLHRFIFGYLKSPVASAFLTVIIVASLVLLPSAFFFAALTAELGTLFNSISGHFDLAAFTRFVESRLPVQFHDQIPALLGEASSLVRSIAQTLSSNLLAFFSNLFNIVFGFVVVLISAYYLLKDGSKVKSELLALSPMGDAQDEEVFNRVVTAVRAVMAGVLVMGVVKGVLAAAAFWIFDVPAPMFWGTMTGFASFIPIFGSGLVTIPAVLYLLIIGKYGSALALLLVAVAIIGAIDNFLQPKLVESQTKIHPLLILLSILGGLQFYGFAGFILGPLTLAVSLAFIDIYKKEFRRTMERAL
jgi:predicted PurR-regulated permease PerM